MEKDARAIGSVVLCVVVSEGEAFLANATSTFIGKLTVVAIVPSLGNE